MQSAPQPGDFVNVRSRRWLVEDGQSVEGLTAVRLACVDDDAQGETVSVLWDAELDAVVLADEGWAAVSKHGTDDPRVFSAYLRTLRWNTATAADRDLFQAPFRAGIHQDAYQLLSLRKALRLPRVNLLTTSVPARLSKRDSSCANCCYGGGSISLSSARRPAWSASGRTSWNRSSA